MTTGLAGMPGLATAHGSACATLAGLLDAAPAGPVFLASYPTASPGPLHATAFLYDNAATAIALVGCGQAERAQRIGDAILLALDHDRFWHDGRLRNGYAAGSATGEPVKLAGWWDDARKRWQEDRYQVGSDSGNMAWAMLALLALDRVAADRRYRDGAVRIGLWLTRRQDSRGAGGFAGGTFGHEPAPEAVGWKSTEHNADLAAAFGRLAEATGDPGWRGKAATAERFVDAMWDSACACFASGTTDDGVTRNPILALDAQVWPLLAIPAESQRTAAVLGTTERRLRTMGGFAYSEASGGPWTEGTAQMTLLLQLLGDAAQATALGSEIEAVRAPDGEYYAAAQQELPTGFMLQTDPGKPRLYLHLPHLGATAWVALTERRFNPFTATASASR